MRLENLPHPPDHPPLVWLKLICIANFCWWQMQGTNPGDNTMPAWRVLQANYNWEERSSNSWRKCQKQSNRLSYDETKPGDSYKSGISFTTNPDLTRHFQKDWKYFTLKYLFNFSVGELQVPIIQQSQRRTRWWRNLADKSFYPKIICFVFENFYQLDILHVWFSRDNGQHLLGKSERIERVFSF